MADPMADLMADPTATLLQMLAWQEDCLDLLDDLPKFPSWPEEKEACLLKAQLRDVVWKVDAWCEAFAEYWDDFVRCGGVDNTERFMHLTLQELDFLVQFIIAYNAASRSLRWVRRWIH